MHILIAQPEDAEALTAIAFAAKRHWGYPESWIQAWSEELTFTAADLREPHTYKAVIDGRITGVCTLKLKIGEAEITALWVSPAFIGLGIGRALFANAEAVAKSSGASRLTILSDPHAEGFYRRMGAVAYGQHPASMDATPRFLPQMEKLL